MERQTPFRLRAKRRVPYAFEVGNTASWEDVFSENSVKNWGRRAREFQSFFSGVSPEGTLRLSESKATEIRLDWLVHMGGPLREVLDHYCDARGESPSGLDLVVSMAPDPVLIFEVHSWLRAHAQRGTLFRLAADERWRSHLGDLKVPAKFERRVFGDRSFESVDRFLEFLWRGLPLNAEQLADLTKASRQKILEASETEPPWSVCRKTGTWLKFHRDSKNTSVRYSSSDIFEIEKRGCLAAAFLSPQDEEQEAKSLTTRDLMLNPTLEVLVRPNNLVGQNLKPLLVVGRYRDSMFEHDLNLVEAAVMEFVREGFRVQEAAVCSSVAAELGNELARGSHEVYQSVQRLKFEGLILASDFGQNV